MFRVLDESNELVSLLCGRLVELAASDHRQLLSRRHQTAFGLQLVEFQRRLNSENPVKRVT